MACEYCKGEERIFDSCDDIDPAVYIEGSELILDYDGVLESVEIECCPMCGEKLGGDA